MRPTSTMFAVAVLLLVGTSPGFAQQGDGTVFNVNDSGVAIQGYDPVAYFLLDEAVAGKREFTAEFAGATFYFSSEDNQKLFQDDPERYAPAYGGWCAWAASRDSIADIDPKAFVVYDGRLFLNFNGWLNWRFKFNLKGNIEKADSNWPDLATEVE